MLALTQVTQRHHIAAESCETAFSVTGNLVFYDGDPAWRRLTVISAPTKTERSRKIRGRWNACQPYVVRRPNSKPPRTQNRTSTYERAGLILAAFLLWVVHSSIAPPQKIAENPTSIQFVTVPIFKHLFFNPK